MKDGKGQWEMPMKDEVEALLAALRVNMDRQFEETFPTLRTAEAM